MRGSKKSQTIRDGLGHLVKPERILERTLCHKNFGIMSEGNQLSPFIMGNSQQMDYKDADDNFFNRERILILLDLYKLYKPKVGRGEVKTVTYPIDAGSPVTHQNVKINGKCCRDLRESS
ncbi:hypothetical protein JTB14_028708 [Gonioctena quinquepunctata]|nr:hypothetical protein JTB14_028708 [Gonioctena quinquepunctata]